ncbi:MAG: DUF222 domain-containing protein [Nocardioidaceae bacterium]
MGWTRPRTWSSCAVRWRGRRVPGGERLVRPGGAGAPACGSFTADELGPGLAMSSWSADRLLADAVDLRHRLPRLFGALHAGRTDAWRARLVAARTRHLGAGEAAAVETLVLDRLDQVSRRRVADWVAGVAGQVDPEAADKQSEQATRRRHVSLDPSFDDHIDVVATLFAGDALRLDARVDQLADLLAPGFPDQTKDQRRARALGLLADPDHAMALLGTPGPRHPTAGTPATTPALAQEPALAHELAWPDRSSCTCTYAPATSPATTPATSPATGPATIQVRRSTWKASAACPGSGWPSCWIAPRSP